VATVKKKREECCEECERDFHEGQNCCVALFLAQASP